MLTALDAAVAIEDLRFPPGNILEEPKGNRVGQYTVRINGQQPADVEIVDYHQMEMLVMKPGQSSSWTIVNEREG